MSYGGPFLHQCHGRQGIPWSLGECAASPLCHSRGLGFGVFTCRGLPHKLEGGCGAVGRLFAFSQSGWIRGGEAVRKPFPHLIPHPIQDIRAWLKDIYVALQDTAGLVSSY